MQNAELAKVLDDERQRMGGITRALTARGLVKRHVFGAARMPTSDSPRSRSMKSRSQRTESMPFGQRCSEV